MTVRSVSPGPASAVGGTVSARSVRPPCHRARPWEDPAWPVGRCRHRL